MKINLAEKILIVGSLETEMARVKRAINAEKSQAIKEIHNSMLQTLVVLIGRVSNEPVEVSK